MKVLRREKYIKVDFDGNNNKFWNFEILDDFSFNVVNGRVGGDGQIQKPKPFSSEMQANAFADKKIREKTRDGYAPFAELGGETADSRVVTNRMALEMAASEQIRTRDTAHVQALIKRLVQANIHSILANTDLSYDEDTGVFKTPLGVVTLDTITKARDLLVAISKHVNGGDFVSDEIKKLLASYLMLIPQKIKGRKIEVQNIVPDDEAIQHQSSILSDLEDSIKQLEKLKADGADKKDSAKPEVPKIFNCEMNIVTDKVVIKEITDFYESNRKTMHASYGFKVKTIYQVKIDDMDEAFEKKGRPIGNIKRLWHGTRVSNVLSILKNGFVIVPSNSSFVSGRMFDDGVYHSDESTKSLNYACGYWGGRYERNCFMFLSDVAMGREYIPKGPERGLPKPGYDSTFAVGGKSGVANNEMIVYSLSSSNIKFLVEFEE
ncbi:WGR domain-containing protein [Pseudomonas syringae pv. actinidiae]|nr:WGR domain-containing protein [Pseudomonas syringae pv. actinidiae]